MTLPPSKLESLISVDSPEKMVEKLREAGCLSELGRSAPASVVELINNTESYIRKIEEGQDLTTMTFGSSIMNRIAEELADSDYLNKKGQELHYG